jgi:hypothetical protein
MNYPDNFAEELHKALNTDIEDLRGAFAIDTEDLHKALDEMSLDTSLPEMTLDLEDLRLDLEDLKLDLDEFEFPNTDFQL